MRIKRYSKVAGKEFDSFLTTFSKMQDVVRPAPYRTGLLPTPVWIGLLCQPTPFEKEFWLVEDDIGNAIGRIGASISNARPYDGNVGFFEVDLRHPLAREAGALLLETAEQWMTARFARTASGPINFNVWNIHRFRTDAHAGGDPAFNWEPVNPPEHVEIWRAAGYSVAQTYRSRCYDDLNAFAKRMRKAYESASADGFSFRPLDPVSMAQGDAEAMYEISLRGLLTSFHFEPIEPEAFRALNVSLPGKTDHGLSHLAFDRKGRGVGYVVAFVDHGHLVLRRRVAVPEVLSQRILSALVYAAAEKALAKGLTKYVAALEPSKTFSPGHDETHLQWTHQYAVFAKSLEK